MSRHWRDRLDRLHATTLPGELALHGACTPPARLRGLAGVTPAPPASRGLLLSPCRSVHTAGMRFALDLVWLGRDGAPLRVDHSVAPWRMRACRRARAVIEVVAGGGDAFADAASGRGCQTRGYGDHGYSESR